MRTQMEIKFTVDANDLNTALGVVSIVTPQTTPQGGGGYLFVVQGLLCSVYSKNSGYEARASFPIKDVVGEGAFMYPAEHAEAFAFTNGDIEITATEEAGEKFKVKYTHGTSGECERVSFDPRGMTSFEKDVEKAKASGAGKPFNIKILQTAVSMAKPFMIKATEQSGSDVNKTIRVFGDADPKLVEKGANGMLYASNTKEAFYFFSTEFLNKDLSLGAQHLPLIEAFLAKSEGATVQFYPTEKKTYIINSKGEVFGWPKHTAQYEKFSYLNQENSVSVRVSAKSMVYQLQYMRAELPKGGYKIRLHFEPSNDTFWFSSKDENSKAKSLPIDIRSVKIKPDQEMVANVNVHDMLHLFEGIKGEPVEFKILVFPASANRSKPVYMFRTVDVFGMSQDGSVVGVEVKEDTDEVVAPVGVETCKATRFATSIE
jgi:hypothetical protein